MASQPTIQVQTQPHPSPFDGLQNSLALELDQSRRYKIAIMGRPKSGKSWFAATMPGFTQIYDFDDRKESLKQLPPEIQKRLHVTVMRDSLALPTVVKTLETDLSNLKYKKLKGQPIPDNFVFDTISNFISNGLLNDYLLNNPKDGRAIKMGGSMLVQIGISFDRINVSNRFLEYLLSEYAALGNVIFVFHERDEKDKVESTKDVIKYTGLITVEPQFASNILTLFNDVFRIEVSNSGVANATAQYQVWTKPTNEVIASTTLLVDQKELPNLADMIQKSETRRAQLAQTK